MEEQINQINSINIILSYIYIGFDIVFILLISLSFLASKQNLIKSLKIRLNFLILIDLINYFPYIYNLEFFGGLYLELFLRLINALQIYLYISIFKKLLNCIKLKKAKNVDKSIHEYRFALFSFLLFFSYHKFLNFNSKILLVAQNILIMVCIYLFYKTLNNPVLLILKNLKKNISKIKVGKNLRAILDLSLYLILGKYIICIIFTLFVDKNYHGFLEMPLNLVIYTKYYNFTFFILIINQLENSALIKNADDDTLGELKKNRY